MKFATLILCALFTAMLVTGCGGGSDNNQENNGVDTAGLLYIMEAGKYTVAEEPPYRIEVLKAEGGYKISIAGKELTQVAPQEGNPWCILAMEGGIVWIYDGKDTIMLLDRTEDTAVTKSTADDDDFDLPIPRLIKDQYDEEIPE